MKIYREEFYFHLKKSKKKKCEEHWINKTVLSEMRIIIYIENWNSAVFGVLISEFTAYFTAMTWKLTRKSHQKSFTPASHWIQLVFSFFYSYTFSCELQTHFSSVQNFLLNSFLLHFQFFVSFGWDWVP